MDARSIIHRFNKMKFVINLTFSNWDSKKIVERRRARKNGNFLWYLYYSHSHTNGANLKSFFMVEKKFRRESMRVKKLINHQIYSNRAFHHADDYQQVQHMLATLRNAIERFLIVNERFLSCDMSIKFVCEYVRV